MSNKKKSVDLSQDLKESPAVTPQEKENTEPEKSEEDQKQEKPKKNRGKLKLFVKSEIRENGKVFNAGDEYKGDYADNFLKIGVIEKR